MPAALAIRMVALVPGLALCRNATQPSAPRPIIFAFRSCPGGRAVGSPVRRVRLDAVSRCPVGVGRGDGVGSAGAGPVHQEHSLGAAGQDRGQGVLDDGAVVLGPAAGDEKAERLAHVWLPVAAEGCLTR